MKGQIKMFETVGVLVVFFFLLSVGFAFYFQMQKSSVSKDVEESLQQKSFNTALKAMYLPELDCSFLVAQRDNCIDLIKADEFSGLVSNNESAALFYYEEFGNSRISLRQVYPSMFDLVLYESKPSGKPVQVISTQTPILIFNPSKLSYGFGILEVLRYV